MMDDDEGVDPIATLTDTELAQLLEEVYREMGRRELTLEVTCVQCGKVGAF